MHEVDGMSVLTHNLLKYWKKAHTRLLKKSLNEWPDKLKPEVNCVIDDLTF